LKLFQTFFCVLFILPFTPFKSYTVQ